MHHPKHARVRLGVGFVLALALSGAALAQTAAPLNDLLNPYRSVEGWARLPAGRSWGSTSGVDIARDGRGIWVAERCGAFAPPGQMKPGLPFACDGSPLAPILSFDSTSPPVESFGGRP